VFEAAHGSTLSLKGLDKANPTALLLLSSAMMLDHLGEREAAQRLREAVVAVIREGKTLTFDLDGTAGTCEMGRAIIERLVRSC